MLFRRERERIFPRSFITPLMLVPQDSGATGLLIKGMRGQGHGDAFAATPQNVGYLNGVSTSTSTLKSTYNQMYLEDCRVELYIRIFGDAAFPRPFLDKKYCLNSYT